MKFFTTVCLAALLGSVSLSAQPGGKKPVGAAKGQGSGAHGTAKPASGSGSGHGHGRPATGGPNKPPVVPDHSSPSTGSSPRA